MSRDFSLPRNQQRRRFLKTAGACASLWGLNALLGSRQSAWAETAADGGVPLPDQEHLLIRNAHVLTQDAELGELIQGDVHIREGQILAVGERLEAEGARVVNAQGLILIPGFVDSHWHMWNSLAKSFIPSPDGQDFGEVMRRLSQAYRPETSYLAVRLAAAEALNSGITTVNNWAHNLRSTDFTLAEYRALRESGLRGRFSYGYAQTLKSDQTMDLAAALHFRERLAEDDRWQFGLALRGPERTEERIWRREWGFARERGIPLSTHISVTAEKQALGAIQTLASGGMLGPDTQLVHAVHASEEDCQAIASTGAPVSLSPYTEMRIGYGIPPIMRLQRAGATIGLSVDNTPLAGSADFFSVMRLTLNLATATAHDQLALTPRQVLHMATMGGARNLRLDDQVGSITPGKRADLLLIDGQTLNSSPMTDAAAIVTQSVTAADIRLVMADGRVMKDEQGLTNLDSGQLIRDASQGWQQLRRRSGL